VLLKDFSESKVLTDYSWRGQVHNRLMSNFLTVPHTNKKLSCRRETARRLRHTLRETDGRTDGQKAAARTRYAVCIARTKGLRPKKPTEKTAGQRSYTVGGHRFSYQWSHQMQVFCITEEVNKQSEFRNDISTRVHKPSRIIRTI